MSDTQNFNNIRALLSSVSLMYIAIFFINFNLVDIYILICDTLILESSHPVVFKQMFCIFFFFFLLFTNLRRISDYRLMRFY